MRRSNAYLCICRIYNFTLEVCLPGQTNKMSVMHQLFDKLIGWSFGNFDDWSYLHKSASQMSRSAHILGNWTKLLHQFGLLTLFLIFYTESMGKKGYAIRTKPSDISNKHKKKERKKKIELRKKRESPAQAVPKCPRQWWHHCSKYPWA